MMMWDICGMNLNECEGVFQEYALSCLPLITAIRLFLFTCAYSSKYGIPSVCVRVLSLVFDGE